MRKLIIGCFLFFNWAILIAQNPSATQNVKDTENLKQGLWVITGEMRKDTSYAASAIIETGVYVDGRKEKLWIRYYPNGNIQSKIYYQNGKPSGLYELYYSNGQLEEQGQWNKNKNTGDFKRFFENGVMMQHFQFAENGKRNGEQLYYHPNGEVEVVVNMIDGKENGSLKRYYSNGELKSEMKVEQGVADKNSYVEYKAKKVVEVLDESPKVERKVADVEKAKPNIGSIDPEGYNKLYTRSLLLKWDGFYHYGKPWNGKKYVYDINGILTRIEVYKNGLYIGNGVIDEE